MAKVLLRVFPDVSDFLSGSDANKQAGECQVVEEVRTCSASEQAEDIIPFRPDPSDLEVWRLILKELLGAVIVPPVHTGHTEMNLKSKFNVGDWGQRCCEASAV